MDLSIMKTLEMRFSNMSKSNLALLKLMLKFLTKKQEFLVWYISSNSSEILTYPSLKVSSGWALAAVAFCSQHELFDLCLLRR